MHVWRNVIISGKKLIRREIKPKSNQQKEDPNDASLAIVGSKQFFKYVFISRNTWILGYVKHIEITLIVLPKRIIDMIRGRGKLSAVCLHFLFTFYLFTNFRTRSRIWFY